MYGHGRTGHGQLRLIDDEQPELRARVGLGNVGHLEHGRREKNQSGKSSVVRMS